MEKETNNLRVDNPFATIVTKHYDEAYFEFQNDIGIFGGWAEKAKFVPFISPNDTVLDFGCGGGHLLKNITCANKVGIEINDTARSYAKKENNIRAVKYIDELDDQIADVIISNHALEHCVSPYEIILKLYNKLKPGGRIIVVVPCEGIHNRWIKNDVNNHLYTWNPMTLGNLFKSAGYTVESVKALYHKWPPFYRQIARLGWPIFNLVSYSYGHMSKGTAQVRVVARKPSK